MDCETCVWFSNNRCFAFDYDIVCSCSLLEKDFFGNWVLNVHGRLWK